MKVRIIERTSPSARKSYVIQQRHFLFRWWWVDVMDDACCRYSYNTLEEARLNLCWFDGTKHADKVVG
jgi:hypothetical protein